MNTSQISFTRVNSDINGNPRYVCHFLNLLPDNKTCADFGGVSNAYNYAVKLANKIGGSKYRAKWYGGGIVFQSYNIQNLENEILKLRENEKSQI